MRRLLLGALSACAVLANCAPADALQVGAIAPGPGTAQGIRSNIGLPQNRINGSYNLVYWVGVTFPNGTFVQAGILDASRQNPSMCQTGFSSFVVALDANGTYINYKTSNPYNSQNCGLKSGHHFRLGISATASDSVTWQWYMGNSRIGPALRLPKSQYFFKRGTGATITELVDPKRAPASTSFPTVEYDPAIEFDSVGDGRNFNLSGGGRFYASSDRTCFYALRDLGNDHFQTGKQTNLHPSECHHSGEALW